MEKIFLAASPVHYNRKSLGCLFSFRAEALCRINWSFIMDLLLCLDLDRGKKSRTIGGNG